MLCMVRNVARERSVTKGHTVVYPNREKAASKTVKLLVAIVLVVSAAIILILTIGGWSKFQGLQIVNVIWAILYVLMAFYIFTRWARGLLPMAAGLGILMLILAVVAGTGVTGASWFDRNRAAFAPATMSASVLGFFTVLLIPVQALQIFFCMIGFSQGWNVETEMPIDEAEKRGYKVDERDREGDKSDKKDKKDKSSAQPATA
jgi:sterol desaturase/sphingolipid hydroxylase (fatty acid hydroxylase superfamily)